MRPGNREHVSHVAMHTPRTPLHLGRPSRVQRYNSSMHRAMEEDSLMIRHDDDDINYNYNDSSCTVVPRRGGGVGLLVSNAIKVTFKRIQVSLLITSFELMEAFLTICSVSLRLIAIYRMPPPK